MAITKEQALIELKKRGRFDLLSKESARAELEKRGRADLIKSEDRGEPGILKQIGSDIVKNIPEIAGATAGGIAGGIGGGLPTLGLGAVPGAVVGAGVGAGAGRAGKQLFQRFTGSPEAPQTSAEAAKDIAIEGAIGATGEFGGQVAFRALSRLVAPFAKKIRPQVKTVKETFSRFKGRFTPAQETETAILDIAENLAEGSFFGGGRVRSFKIAQEEALGRMQKDISQQFAKNATDLLSDREVGLLFLNSAKKGRAAHMAISQKLYSEVDTVAKGVEVNMGTLRDAAVGVAQRFERVKGIGQNVEIKKLIKAIQNIDESIPFSDAQSLRSALLSKSRDLVNVPGEGSTRRIIGEFVENIDRSMETASNRLGGEALKQWRRANRFFKLGKDKFDNDFMARLIIQNKKSPERIGETIIRSGNVQEINQAKRAVRLASLLDKSVNFDETWRAMQSGFVEKLLSESTDQAAGSIRGRSLINKLKNRKLRRTLAATFNKDQVRSLDDFARIASITQERPAGGAGMVMQLAQGGAVAGLVTGSFPEASAGIFITPVILSRILTNPTGIKLLTEGFRVPLQTQRGFALTGLIAAQVAKERIRKNNLNK